MSGDTVPSQAPLVVNGWSIYAHPLFLDQLELLIEDVEARKARDPKTWPKTNCTKRLAAIFKLVIEAIPADPGAAAFRQSGTLGDHRKHWFRAKFFQQYRLFYRFNSDLWSVSIAPDETFKAGIPAELVACSLLLLHSHHLAQRANNLRQSIRHGL